MAKLANACALVMLLLATAAADPAPPPAIDDAIKDAAAANKPLVVEFSTTWCGPCKLFATNVLSRPDVQHAIGDVAFVHYDAEAAPGDAAASRYAVDAYPTFLVLDRQGIEVKRVPGMLPADAFIGLLAEARTATASEAEIRADVKAHPQDTAVHLKAARWFVAHEMAPDAIRAYGAVIGDAHAPQADRIEARVAVDHLRRSQRWRAELVADKVDLVRTAPATVPVDDVAVAFVDSGLPAADVHTLAALVLGASTDVARTNSLVYICLAAGAGAEALTAAQKMVALSRQAQFVDTLAECFHVTGDHPQAVQTETDALHLATGESPLEPVLRKNLARFQAGTGDADEIAALHARVAALDKRLDEVDRLPDAPVPRPEQAQAGMAEWRKAFEAERELARSVGTACAPQAGKTDLAIARIELSGADKITSASVLLDETATPKLRACIRDHLVGAMLPPLNFIRKRQLTIALRP